MWILWMFVFLQLLCVSYRIENNHIVSLRIDTYRIVWWPYRLIPNFDTNHITPLDDKLDANKYCGIDGIGPKILKHCGDNVTIPLASIINKCIDKCVFLESIKEAFVIPINKRGDKNDPSNFNIYPFLFYRLFPKYLNGLYKTKCKTNSINTIWYIVSSLGLDKIIHAIQHLRALLIIVWKMWIQVNI